MIRNGTGRVRKELSGGRAMRLGLGTAMALAALMICLGLLPLQPAPATRGTSAPPATPSGGAPARPAASPHAPPWREGGRWVRTGLAAWTNALLAPPGPGGRLVAGTASGLSLSSDGGATWQRVESAVPIASLAASADGGTVYAGGADGRVYALVNQGRQGQRWRRISARLSSDAIFSLAAAPPDGHILLAGSTGALYRGVATPTGRRWRRVARSGDAAVSAITWAPWNAHIAVAAVFAATPAVLVSRDDGKTWRAETEGLPANLPSETLLPITAPTPTMILSTMGGGVWQRGATGRWRDISAGLPERHAMSLVSGAADGSGPLYAGTMGNGVYVRDGTSPWRRLGHGLNGGAYTVLALARVAGPHPALLAGTARGVFRYAPP